MSCQDCQRDPELKMSWGCEEPSQLPVWEDEETGDEYFRCPLLFIPLSIIEWYSEYNYYKEYSGTAPSYWEQGEKWIDIAITYNGYYNSLMNKIQERQMAKMNSRGSVING